MKHRNNLHSILAASLLLGLPLAAAGEPTGCPLGISEIPPPPMGAHGPFPFTQPPPYLKGLDLGLDQHKKIAEILKTQGAELQDKAGTGHESHEELRRLAFSADYSEDKAKALVEANAKAMAGLAVLHARMDHAIYATLTPEQQRQVQANLADFRARFPKR